MIDTTLIGLKSPFDSKGKNPVDIILVTSLAKKSGGARQALYLAQGFQERGHTVTFFLPGHSTLRSLAPDFENFADLGLPAQWRSNIEAAMPTDGTPCIVHAFHNAAVKRAAWWGLFWRKRAVVVAHRGVIFRPNNPLPYWSPGIDAFLVNSNQCARVLQRVGLQKKRLYLVPNSVPESRITPRTPRPAMRQQLNFIREDLVFGTVANNTPVKGVKELLHAFAQVRTACPLQPLKLIVLGVKPVLWAPLADKLNISGQTTFVDHTEDVASHLASLDVFVQPSLSESMPNTLLEAVRMGLPCIGTTVGAIAEVIADCGLTVPPANSEALAQAMKQFIDNPELLPLLGKKTLRIAEQYKPDNRLDLVEKIYLDLLWKKGLVR